MFKKTITLTIILLLVCTIRGHREEWLNVSMRKFFFDKAERLYNTESYDELREVSKNALHLIGPADWMNQSLFNFYIAQSYRNQNTDTAILFFEKAAFFAEKSGSFDCIVDANAYLLFMYNRCVINCKAKRDLLFIKIKELVQQSTEFNHKSLLLDALADYYDMTGQETLYLSSILKSIYYSEQYIKLGKATAIDSNNLGVLYQNIGRYYYDSNQGNKSLEFYELSRKWIKNYKRGIANFYMGNINAFLLKNELIKAQIYIDSLDRYALEGGDGVDDVLIRANIEIVIYYTSRNNMAEAWKAYHYARRFVDSNANELTNGRMKWLAALLLTKTKRYNEALLYLKTIEKQAPGWALNEYVPFLKTYAQCCNGLKKYDIANQYFQLYIMYADSLNNRNLYQSLAHAEAEYQNERKQSEIDNQENAIRLAQRQHVWLSIALSSMVIVAFLMYLIYRNKKKTALILNNRNIELQHLNHQLNEANRTKATLFTILSHDLRAPISDVYQFLKIQYMDSNILSDDEKKVLEEELKLGAASLLETMEDLLIWSKMQLEFIQTDIQDVDIDKLFKQCQDLLQLNIQSKGITILNKIPPHSIVQTDANFLQTIIRNLLQNAIKASPKNGVIEVGFLKAFKTHTPSFWLENTGHQFSQENYHKAISESGFSRNLHHGLGLKLIEELSQRINVEVRFEIIDEVKTCCTLIFH